MLRSHIVYILFIIVSCTELLHAQGGVNTQLVGQVRTRGTNNYSNCWGYVSPGGKEYAILGCNTGTQIVDITTDTLKEVAFITGPTSGWREMKVYKNYAYVVTEGTGAGLQIIDMDSLKLVNTITTTQVPSGHTISIEGKYLYISGSRYKNGGVVVLDLTNPVNPTVVGEYQSEYIHDCVIKNDTIYAAAIYGIGVDIIDATNKANIKRVSVTNYPYSGTHNTDVTADGKYVLSTDEINSNPDKNGNLLRVWDRTDVTNLKLVATYVARPQTIVHNIHLKGDYGYLAHYSEGLRILDLKYPSIPVEIGYYDTFVGSVNNYVGAWGTFPYFASNKVIISDISGGLYVIKFPGQNGSLKAARAILTVRDSVTNLPVSDVKVVMRGRFDTLVTDNLGQVRFGATTDTMTVTISKSTYSTGYATVTKMITMKFDSVINITVPIKQTASGSLKCVVTNKTNSAPVKNFRIRVIGAPIEGVTDSLGKFTIPALLGGNTFSIIASQWGFAAETASVKITGGVENTFNFQLTPYGLDNFESESGWTVGSAQDSGSSGKWERAKPNAAVTGIDTLQPKEDHTVNGTLCFVTGASSTVTDYVDYRTTLTSPVFSPKSFAVPTIIFWNYFNSRSAAKDDTLYVDLSNNNGLTWKNAIAINGKLPFWKQYKIDIKSILTVSDEMKIRFVAKDGGLSSVFDAAVDDVEFGENLQLTVEHISSHQPDNFALHQNFPNPFNPSTTIQYEIPVKGPVTLIVHDMLGKEIASLVNQQQDAGIHTVEFNAENLSSGIYFYTLRIGSAVMTKKLVVMR
ncbi:MAG: choice-of-anchor B family protein [Bacteroidota bacterium]